MCNCLSMCRTPEMTTHEGKYPPASHHPECEDFKLEEFARLEMDGQFCIMEPHEAESFIRDAINEGDYKQSVVMLTRDQFEALPEFDGF